MKKLLMMGTLALCLASNAELNYSTSTEAEWREAANILLASTNQVQFTKAWMDSKFWGIKYSTIPNAENLRLEFDDAFAKKGFGTCCWFSRTFPKTALIELEQKGYANDFPKLFAIASRLKCDATPGDIASAGATVDDFAAMIDELIRYSNRTGKWTMMKFHGWQQILQRVAVKAVKKRLRAMGKSFVTKNGINPCSQYMDALTAALNAPRYSGLNAWLESMGCENRISDNLFPSEQEINNLKEAILMGDKDMTEYDKSLLQICLGVDAYNAFVKEYNGD